MQRLLQLKQKEEALLTKLIMLIKRALLTGVMSTVIDTWDD